MFDTTITRPDGDGPTGEDRLYRLELWDDLPPHIEYREPVTYDSSAVVKLYDTGSFHSSNNPQIARIGDEPNGDERQLYAIATVPVRYMAEWFTRRESLFADFNELAAWLEEFLTAYLQRCRAIRERLDGSVTHSEETDAN